MCDTDTMLFLAQSPAALNLYRDFETKVLESIANVSIRVQKTQITLANKHVFSCVSQMKVRRKKELPAAYIVITFGLNYPLESPRIAARTEPYPNRWTHHVVVAAMEEIDDELMTWVKEASMFSAQK